MRLILVLLALMASPVFAGSEPIKIKRPNLIVPDLDAAIHFYRDILGFKFEGADTSSVRPNSYSYVVFELPADAAIRMALFSTASESRALAITEVKGVPVSIPASPRVATIVVQTDRLAEIEAMAKKEGLKTYPVRSASGSGRTFNEMGVIDPAGHLVTMFEYTDGKP